MRLELASVAESDLARIDDFNQQRSSQWAAKVQRRLSERMRALLSAPDLGRPVLGQSVKRLSVPDIQYVIDYEPVGGGIRILRVRHTREIR